MQLGALSPGMGRGSGGSDNNHGFGGGGAADGTDNATGAPATSPTGAAASAGSGAAVAASISNSSSQAPQAESAGRLQPGNSGNTTDGRGSAPGPSIPAPSAAAVGPTSLSEVLRAPGVQAPDVHVISQMPSDLGAGRKDPPLNPREDLWLTTFDGRYNSAIVPVHVGVHPDAKTFTVHKHVLERTEFFRKALSGRFRESETQTISLPEEDPAIFHHVIAFLYEGRYEPIKPIASELIPDVDKGKGREPADPMDTDSDSADSILSTSTARSNRRRDRRRRREDRMYENLRQKHPGVHRPNCNCPQCLAVGGSPCWNCNAPRRPPPPGPPAHVLRAERERERHRNRRNARRQAEAMGGVVGLEMAQALGIAGAARAGVPPLLPGGSSSLAGMADPNGGRIKGEDMRTWLLTYELNLDVYICANKFLMQDFKRAVARASIDMLESAGSDAAHPQVLELCRRLYDGLGTDTDPLLRMVFARVGFLQPVFARGPAADETTAFLLANPDIVALILRETTNRREEDLGSRALPSMERPMPFGGPGAITPGSIFDTGPFVHQGRAIYPNHHHAPPHPPRFA